MHVMGGLSGFVGTYVIGPRIGLFKTDKTLSYITKDDELNLMENVYDDESHLLNGEVTEDEDVINMSQKGIKPSEHSSKIYQNKASSKYRDISSYQEQSQKSQNKKK